MTENNNSYFDGGLLHLIALNILGFVVTVLTLGIAYPWALCLVYGWKINHTVIEGRRLQFNGTAIGLFGNWIKWLLLTIVTVGIYAFWLGIALQKWKVKHTTFAN
ncbi:MAG: YjgN family protein [Defluviitaleaceae bacterium]|nr:YjgN family protein [Defluviitaleaceae bacterium]